MKGIEIALLVQKILLNVLILPIGGASEMEDLLSTGPTPSSYYNCNTNCIFCDFLGFDCWFSKSQTNL